MDRTQSLIDNILSGNPAKAEDDFNAIMARLTTNALDDKKIEINASAFDRDSDRT